MLHAEQARYAQLQVRLQQDSNVPRPEDLLLGRFTTLLHLLAPEKCPTDQKQGKWDCEQGDYHQEKYLQVSDDVARLVAKVLKVVADAEIVPRDANLFDCRIEGIFNRWDVEGCDLNDDFEEFLRVSWHHDVDEREVSDDLEAVQETPEQVKRARQYNVCYKVAKHDCLGHSSENFRGPRKHLSELIIRHHPRKFNLGCRVSRYCLETFFGEEVSWVNYLDREFVPGRPR